MRSAKRFVAITMVLVTLLSLIGSQTLARQGDGTPAASDSVLAGGLPAGITLTDLVSDGATGFPDAPAVLRLEQITIAPGGLLGGDGALAAPEIIQVTAGEIEIADDFGFSSKLSGGDGSLLQPGSIIAISNQTDTDATLLRVTVRSADAAAAGTTTADATGPRDGTPASGTPVSGTPVAMTETDTDAGIVGVETEILAEGPIRDDLPGDAVFYLTEAVFAPGADTGDNTLNGPTGLYLESGDLTVTSPSGVEGTVQEGRGVVLPAGVALTARNEGDGDVAALLFGIVPAGSGLVEVIEPTATATSEATATVEQTATQIPPTNTPTQPPTPTSDLETPSGTILQSGEAWDTGTSRLTVNATANGGFVEVILKYENTTNGRVDFSVSSSALRMYDDLRGIWEVQSWNDFGSQRVILNAGESIVLDATFLITDQSGNYSANVFLAIAGFGALAEGRWGWTFDNGRILTLPPDAVDPTASNGGSPGGEESTDASSSNTITSTANQSSSNDASSLENDAITKAVAISDQEFAGDFSAMYQSMHPDARAIIPEQVVVGWFTDYYAGIDASDMTVTGVELIPWTWGVTGETYPQTAEIAFTYTLTQNGASSTVAEVVRLVQDDSGEWCWFFGRTRDFVDEQIAIYS